MNTIQEFHQQAMVFAERADIARLEGDFEKAKEFFRQALELEAKAAWHVADRVDYEPTRSILFRSAASLAIDFGDSREAERLIAKALTGNPPTEIAEELRDLFEQVNFQRHLELRGVSLNPEELQLSVSGNAVGFGLALSDTVIQRIKDLEKLVHRTYERLQNRAFRERGPVGGFMSRHFSFYMSVPRSGSFSVTLRLGEPSDQLMFPGFDKTEEVVDEVLECLQLVNDNRKEDLKRKIPEGPYFKNFIALARNLAPDGEDIKIVNLTVTRENRERKLSLTKPRDEISLAITDIDEVDLRFSPRKIVRIIGQLRYADSIEVNEVKIVDDQGKKHTVIVPEGMMNDVVRPLWDYRVEITGYFEGKKIRLTDFPVALG